MSARKLDDLLQNKRLYLRHLEKQQDEHEGSMPAALKADLDAWASGFDPANRIPALFPACSARKWHYISCWCMRPSESEALWRLYGGNANGTDCVAITSTYSLLKSCFPDSDDIGRVRYLDFSLASLKEVTEVPLQFLKRVQFEYEHEVRIVRRHIKFAPESKHKILLPNHDGFGYLSQDYWESLYDQPEGLLVEFDPETVVTSIVVSPYASAEYAREIRDSVVRLGMAIPVKASAMARGPIRG